MAGKLVTANGWRLQAGSLTPVYSDYYTVHHYLFIDSTGAEYRLDTNLNNAGVWTSKEGIYVSYDSNAGRLYFPDGSFWTFGSASAGTEQDSGTLYPTLMEDTNGNQVARLAQMPPSTFLRPQNAPIPPLVVVHSGR